MKAKFTVESKDDNAGTVTLKLVDTSAQPNQPNQPPNQPSQQGSGIAALQQGQEYEVEFS